MRGPRYWRSLFVFAFFLSVIRAAAQGYAFVPFDPPDSTATSPAEDVNDAGVVIGRTTAAGAFTWTESAGRQAPLVTPPADAARFPRSGRFRLNAAGKVLGSACATVCPDPTEVPATWTASDGLSFLPLDAPGFGTATAINGSGTVLGRGQTLPAIWRSGQAQLTISDLSDAFDINDAEQVAGRCVGGPCGAAGSAAIWTEAGGRVIIPRLLNHGSNVPYTALAINNAGHVVGWYAAPDIGIFLWSPANGTVDLSSPLGSQTQAIEVLDINDLDLVVTTVAQSGATEPFLYKNGAWKDLNTLVPPGTRMHLTRVNAINNKGWMAGSGTNFYPADFSSGFVLMPPIVDMTANGLDGPITRHAGSSLQIAFEFDPHSLVLMAPAELYVGVATSTGVVVWFTATGPSTQPARLYAGPLPALGPATLLNIPNVALLPTGTYYWFAVVDADTNGTVNFDFFDYVETSLVP